MVRDDTSGRFLAVPEKMAAAVQRAKAADVDPEAYTNEDMREVLRLKASIGKLGDQDLFAKKKINPIFINLPLLDLSPYHRILQPLARLFVGWFAMVLLLTLMVVAIFLGVRNNWAIGDLFSDSISIEGLLTFAAVAPFLKILHELGHVLVATKAGVRVRQAGVYIIGLYPMPYVDCTEADFSAPRRDRVMISIAGIWVDITIGFVAFILWHFSAGGYLQTLFGHIFVFSTLNSLLFNLNPLIKLDGYYALVDVIGQRNLYTRSQKTLRNFLDWFLTLGQEGNSPELGREWLMIVYAILAFCYRIVIMYVIASALLPQHFGIGVIIVVWGASSLFLSPLSQDRMVNLPDVTPKIRNTRYVTKLMLFAAVIAAMIFIKVPQTTTFEMYLDTETSYGVTLPVAGRLETRLEMKQVRQGDLLIKLQNAALESELELMDAELITAELILDSVRGDDPAQTAAALRRRDSIVERGAILSSDFQLLELFVETDGLFVPDQNITSGEYLQSGSHIGVIFPPDTSSEIRGRFPERYLELYFNQDIQADIRLTGGSHFTLDPNSLFLQPIVERDAEGGKRSYQMRAQIGLMPSETAGQLMLLKLSFGEQPLWHHAWFWWETQILKFKDTQVTERLDRLEG